MTRLRDKPVVIGVRSCAFVAASALISVVLFPLYLVLLPAPVRIGWPVWRAYVKLQLWLLRVICGLGYRVVGAENLPAGSAILASRHEAMWETLFLPVLFDNPAVLLKQEILRYPLAGPVARRLGYIGIDRTGAPEQAREALDAARAEAATGRRVLIFPSGTRDPRHRFRVQKGVAVLYRALGLPCVPVVLDSGDYWPYRSWMRRPGTITVRVLEPVPAGLRTTNFLQRLEAELARPA